MRLRECAVSAATLAVLAIGCGEDPPTKVRDITPPAKITNLAAENGASGYFLTWTAPGDDDTTGTVSRYDIRCFNGDLMAHWSDATPLPAPASLAPAGQTQTAAIGSLAPGVWQFAVKAADEVPNWSDLSNVGSVTIVAPDTIPPESVTDLSAEAIIGGVKLHWTAPGDDGQSGTAAVYDLRFSHQTITPESWAAATPLQGATPKTSGEPESATVSNLQEGQEYSFALKSADEKGNWSGISNIATIYLPQTTPRQLTFNTTNVGATIPDWSPDGFSILCSMGVADFKYQIYGVQLAGESPEQYTFPPDQAQMPDWSPDGAHFAFVATDPDGYNWRLAVMAATPGAARTILASHVGLNVGTPQWSPDGTQIAYRAFSFAQGRLASSLYVIPSDGGTPTHLAGPFTNSELSWSPDGTMIAFDSDQSGSMDIWIMPSIGGQATRLTMGADREAWPAWAPDGAVIAYIAGGQIWGVAPTGGASFLLVNDNGVGIGAPAWSPDGRSLAYAKGSPPNIWVAGVNPQN